MKELMSHILSRYSEIFPKEKEKVHQVQNFLEQHTNDEIIDWNCFDGHIVASGFIYAKKEKKFLVVYHKDLNMKLYPGGHMIKSDESPLSAARREVSEETGITNEVLVPLIRDSLIPFDIGIHKTPYNKRLDLPAHYHFDMRYLFTIESIQEIDIDKEELSSFCWISFEEFASDIHFGELINKIRLMLGI